MRARWSLAFQVVLLSILLVSGCGGSGGGGVGTVPFSIAASTPADGSADANVSQTIVITFTRKTDLATVTPQSMRLERSDGSVVPTQIIAQDFNSANVRLDPIADLVVNEVYRVRIGASVLSEEGQSLGRDHLVCFLIASPTPAIRPDQVLDLGDALNVPRFHARGLRAPDGRFFLFGGHRDTDVATDTIEVYDPATRTFRLLDARMQSPRAEHTATLLSTGKILLAGGVAAAGGAPLSTTDLFDPAHETCGPGPALNQARHWHGASNRQGTASVLLAGGYDADGEMMETLEYLDGNRFVLFPEPLAEPSAEQTLIRFDYDQVYCTASNFSQVASIFDGAHVDRSFSVDIRFRAAWAQVDLDRWMVAGGNTRSILFLDADGPNRHMAGVLMAERRGAHSLTLRSRGTQSDFYLAAGGFNIGIVGAPSLSSAELIEYVRNAGPNARGDAVIHRLTGFSLPVPFAGHVGFTELTGSTVLAGGVGEADPGPHSRRVVVILNDANTPPISCGG